MAQWSFLFINFDPKPSRNQLARFNKVMEQRDYDWISDEVFSDGIRMRCRSPLYDQEELIETMNKYHIYGFGYLLEYGISCQCVEEQGQTEPCSIGSAWACRPEPNDGDWFLVKPRD